GFDKHDIQPSGITINPPTPYEIGRARDRAALNRQLRDRFDQLPPHVQAAIGTPKRRRLTVTEREEAARRAPGIRAIRKTRHAERLWDAYETKRLNVEDNNHDGRSPVTVFDRDEPRPGAKPRKHNDETVPWDNVDYDAKSLNNPDDERETGRIVQQLTLCVSC